MKVPHHTDIVAIVAHHDMITIVANNDIGTFLVQPFLPGGTRAAICAGRESGELEMNIFDLLKICRGWDWERNKRDRT